MPVLGASKKIGDILVFFIKETGSILYDTIDTTRIATSRTLQSMRGAKREAPYIASQAVISAIRTGYDAGAELGTLTKDTVIGVLEGVGDVTKITPGILSVVARAAVRETRELGGDVNEAARKAVEGAIEAGKKTGLKAEEVASASALGAVAAASELSVTTAKTVAKTLTNAIPGVHIVLKSPTQKLTVLIINGDKKDLELLGQQLSKEEFNIYKASNETDIDKILQSTEDSISIAIIDVTNFDECVWDYCKKIKKLNIPFLIIAPKRSSKVQQESMKHGAGGVLIKPLGAKELTEYIRGLLGN